MSLSPAKIKQYGDLRAKQATGPLTNADSTKLEKLAVEMTKPKAKKRTTKKATLALAPDASKKPAAPNQAPKRRAAPKK